MFLAVSNSVRRRRLRGGHGSAIITTRVFFLLPLVRDNDKMAKQPYSIITAFTKVHDNKSTNGCQSCQECFVVVVVDDD
jgi:hypothetical protein